MPDFTAQNVLIGLGKLSVDGTSVGYTSGGVMIVMTADRMDLEVDQSYAPVGIHKVKETFELRTSLAEATLANLKTIWEQTEAVVEASPTRTLSWGMNPNVIEHTLAFVGKSPEGYDRTYTVYKAAIWEVGEVTHQKDAITVVPVTFRILPDIDKGIGKEYGKIVDQMV